MDLTVILGSAFLGTIVTGLFSWGTYQKTHSLKYITEERETWRDEMRTILEEISGCSPTNISGPLTKLKLRIDSRGLIWSRSLHDDHHIWKVIKRLEDFKKSYHDPDKFPDDKQLLIDFLCLLLRQDWRRSNREVESSKNNVNGIVLFFVSITLYIYIYIGSFISMDLKQNNSPKTESILKLILGPEFMLLTISFALIWTVPFLAKKVLIKCQRDSEKELTATKIYVCTYIVYVVFQAFNLYCVFDFFRAALAELGVNFELTGLALVQNEVSDTIPIMFILIPIALMVISTCMRIDDMIHEFNFAKAYYFSIKKLLKEKNRKWAEKMQEKDDDGIFKDKYNEEFEKYHIPQ